jgi:hypothetical protein
MHTTLTRTRDLAPYFLIEPLLPGATALALLLWLSLQFVRSGFSSVRHYTHPQTLRCRHVAAPGRRPALKTLRLCLKRCAVVRVWRNGFHQWCRTLGAARACCS